MPEGSVATGVVMVVHEVLEMETLRVVPGIEVFLMIPQRFESINLSPKLFREVTFGNIYSYIEVRSPFGLPHCAGPIAILLKFLKVSCFARRRGFKPALHLSFWSKAPAI